MKPKLTKILEYLFYLFVFLLPWQTRWIIKSGLIRGEYWEYGSFSLYGTDILLIIILIIFLFSDKKRFEFNQSLRRLWPLILAWLLINFVSGLIALDKGIALYGLAKLLEAVILFYLVLRLPISIKKTSLVIIITASLQAAFCLGQFLVQRVPAFKWLGLAEQLPALAGVYVIENSLGRFLRGHGSLHPIILSYFLAVSLIIVFGLYFLAKKQNQKIFVWSALFLIVLGLILTFGRVAWLSALFGLAAFLIIVWGQLARSGRLKTFIFLTVMVVGTAAFVLIFKDVLVTRFSLNERLEQVSINERSYYLQDAVKLTKKYWYEGVGDYNFTVAVRKKIDAGREVWNYQPPNNLFILILVEASAFGLLIFLWLLLEIFRIVFRKLQQLDLKKDYWFVVYTVCFILLLITAFFDHTYWTLQFGLLFFWLILGLWARSLELTD